VIDALEDQAAFDAWLAEQRPVPARAVSLDEMRRWTMARLREVRERSRKQLAKDWRRTTPDKAARVVEVGEAILKLIDEIGARP
jgi:hypothetical protein